MSKLLITLRDEEISTHNALRQTPLIQIDGQRVRGIIRDSDNNIATVWTTPRLLPGGGVEPEDKNLVEALKRECLEEIGCNVEIECEIGYSDEYRLRNFRKQISHQTIHCFTGKVVGEKGKPQTTQENELKMEISWLPLDEIIITMENHLDNMSEDKFKLNHDTRSQLAFLKEYKENYANRS